MKRTQPLKIMVDSSFPLGKVVVHPNEGFDLGLMNTSYPVKIYLNCRIDEFRDESNDPLQGQILLENRCREGYVELAQKNWIKIGSPDKALLVYDAGKLLVLSVPKTKQA